MPVVHSPLVTSILAAIANNQPLVLPPGKHATDKHSRATIAVPATGLQILSDPTLPRPIIQRPNNGLDGDDQCGLHFVPDHPTQPEIDAAQWKVGVIGERLKDFKNGPEFTPPVDAFEYEILVRGDITIQDVDIDCNMQNQPLNQQKPGSPWEHSAMLRFHGIRYDSQPVPGLDFGTSPRGLPRRMFVAFRSVTIQRLDSSHGDVADDIFISRSNFHPNIQQVTLDHIRSFELPNRKRATIGFDDLAANISISDCDLFSLHFEDDVPWDTVPRQTPDFQKASVQLTNIRTQLLDLAAKGFVLDVDGQGLEITRNLSGGQASGSIRSSKIFKDQIALLRMDMEFTDVEWGFPVILGQVHGLKMMPVNGEPCRAVFTRNTFTAAGQLPTNASGVLIAGEFEAPLQHVSGQQVFLSFRSCQFDPRMGSLPNTFIAQPTTRGTWTFDQDDLHGLRLERVFLFPNHDIQGLKQVLLMVF